MTTFVALLRGINVGGKNKLPMDDLRILLRGLGFGNAQTYIQSGNVVFTANEANHAGLSQRIEAAVEERFGFFVNVIILTVAEICEAVNSNPFNFAAHDPSKFHLGIMSAQADDSAVENLRTKPQGSDQWSVLNKFFYLYTPDGIGKSVFSPFVERTLKVPVTFRNWRTILTIIEMAK